jgi:hypothetical protein
MSEEKISDGFKELGENLAGLLKAAWDRPERVEVQREIESGLQEVGSTLSRAVEDFSGSDLGRKVQSDLAGLKEKVEKGEVDETVRGEIRSALKSVNEELEKLIRRLRTESKEST